MKRRLWQLASQVLAAIRERNKGLETGQVEDVILGCVTPVGEQGANIARTAVMAAGYDESVPGVQVNRFCASGLEAINMAAAKVMSGQSPMAVGGGVEAMSRVPMSSTAAHGRWTLPLRCPLISCRKASAPTLLLQNTATAATMWTPIRSRATSGQQDPGRRAASPSRRAGQ